MSSKPVSCIAVYKNMICVQEDCDGVHHFFIKPPALEVTVSDTGDQ